MPFEQAKMTKVKSHYDKSMYLANMYKKWDQVSSQSLYMANTLQKSNKKRKTVDNMLKQASHREPIQHEVLQNFLWQKPNPTDLVQ